MAPCTFNMKFPLDTQFTFESLTFAVGEERHQDAAPRASARASHSCSLIYVGQNLLRFGSFCRVIHSHRQTRSGYSDRDVYPLTIHQSTKFVFISIVPSQDSSDDYPEIGDSACGNSAKDIRLILMVAPNGDRSRNSSCGYPTIGRSKTSDAQTPSAGLVQNLNSDFNVIQVQVIMETIQCMASDGSPFALLAQQGAEVVNLVVALFIMRPIDNKGYSHTISSLQRA
jgi:hypothetical protein